MNIDDELKDAAERTNRSLAGTTVPPLRQRTPRGWANAALAAAVTIVVVGAAALLTRGAAPVTTTLPTGLPSTTPSTVSTAPPSTIPGMLPPLDGWELSGTAPSVFENAAITSAALIDGRIVVAGCNSADAVLHGFPAWTSQDAVSWEQATGIGQAATSEFGCLSDITATPFGLYARAGSLFYSTDGRTWQGVDLPTPNLEGAATSRFVVDAIFSTSDRVTVLLSTTDETPRRAMLLTTTDGTSWTEGPADSEAQFDSSIVADVLVTDTGLIAVGSSDDSQSVPSAAVWTSTDGLNWQRVTNTGVDFFEAFINAVIETQGGFVAVGGSSATGQMAAWSSTDGTVWHRVSRSEQQPDAGAATSANAITQVGGILYAAGEDMGTRSSPQGHLALWTSADGATWQRVQQLTFAVPFNIIQDSFDLVGFWPPRQWIDIQQPTQILLATPTS